MQAFSSGAWMFLLAKTPCWKGIGRVKGRWRGLLFLLPPIFLRHKIKECDYNNTNIKRQLSAPPPGYLHLFPVPQTGSHVINVLLALLSRSVLKFTNPRFFRKGQYIVMEENSVRNFKCGPEEAWPIRSICSISKIQLVVYYHCCVLTGWATTRLHVIAH